MDQEIESAAQAMIAIEAIEKAISNAYFVVEVEDLKTELFRVKKRLRQLGY